MNTFAEHPLAAVGAETVVLAAGLQHAAEELHTAATTWYAEQERLVASMAPGTTDEDVSAYYAIALGDVRAELQKTFAARPPPAEEPAHENGPGTDGIKKEPKAWESRLHDDVSMILDAVEDAVVNVCRTWDAPEAQTRASFEEVKLFARVFMVLAGAYLRIIFSASMHKLLPN